MEEKTEGKTKTALELSRENYAERTKAMQDELARGFQGTNSHRLSVITAGFASGTVDLFMAGLEDYIAVSAKNRASAEADRQADREAAKADREKQERDRDQQKADRATMNHLTMAIMAAAIASAFGTVYGALHPPKAPTFNIPSAPAPIVQVLPATSWSPPAPVSPAPVTRPADPKSPRSPKHDR